MAENVQEQSQYGDLIKFALWTIGAILTWIVVSLLPPVRESGVAFAWLNLIMLMLVLPGAMLVLGMGYFVYKSNHIASSICLLIAIVISEILNLIPFNPFALALPFCILCQISNFSVFGHFKAAELCARRLLFLWTEKSSVNSRWRLAALNSLAAALQGQGRYGDADKVIDSMLKAVEANTAEDEFQAITLTDLSGNLSKMGRAAKALQIADKALSIWHTIPNMTHEQNAVVSITLNQIGYAHECAGDFKRALEFYRKSLSTKIEVYGEDAIETAIGYSNVGYALTETGQYDEAAQKLEKAKDLCVKAGMQNNTMWAHILENIGDLHRAQGDLVLAEKELLEALDLRKKRYKEDLHHSYHDLGKLYRDKKDWKTSRAYFEKALAIREKRFTAATAQTLQEFAKLLIEMDEVDEANALKQRATEIMA